MPSDWSLSLARKILDIPSPSRVFTQSMRTDHDFDERPPMPPPWYSARSPGAPHASLWTRRQARLVRRMIRRHWFALLFDPESPEALSVREAMLHALEEPERENVYAQIHKLLDAGTVRIDPDAAAKWMKEIGIRVE